MERIVTISMTEDQAVRLIVEMDRAKSFYNEAIQATKYEEDVQRMKKYVSEINDIYDVVYKSYMTSGRA